MRRSNCHACARVSENRLAQSRSFVRPESRFCLARNFHTELGRQKKQGGNKAVDQRQMDCIRRDYGLPTGYKMPCV